MSARQLSILKVLIFLTALIPLVLLIVGVIDDSLGGKRWQTLHYTVYGIGILASVHYFWLVKPVALPYPLTYALLLAILPGWRLQHRIRRK